MAEQQLGAVVRHLRRLAGSSVMPDTTDEQLLERFALHGEGEAFAALVERHGTLVWGVCRRLLGHDQDAEDAFQATFLILARKAGSIRKRGSLASWLYQVGHHVALRARLGAHRRQLRERRAAAALVSDPQVEVDQRELRAVLDEELSRLPEKYRAPLVLCYLEGRNHAQAARELGCPPGSMSWRLARGRELLRARLTRRGLGLPAGVLAVLLSREAVSARVPGFLVRSATDAVLLGAADRAAAGVLSTEAVLLTKGALHAMWITNLKLVAAVVLAVSMAGAGGGVAAYRALAAGPGDGSGQTQTVPAGAKDESEAAKDRPDLVRLEQELRQERLRVQLLVEKLKQVRAHADALERKLKDLSEHQATSTSLGGTETTTSRPLPQTREATAREAAPSRPTPPLPPEVAAAWAPQMRDQVELLKAQLQARRAEVRAAQIAAEGARASEDRARDLSHKGAIDQAVFAKAQQETAAQEAKLLSKQAELKEVEVRLRQAQRRLAVVAQPTGRSAATAQRLQDLEKKLDVLRQELEDLRRQRD